MDVSSGRPVKLVPVQDPGTPTVSNAMSVSSRTLIRCLQLELRVRRRCGRRLLTEHVFRLITGRVINLPKVTNATLVVRSNTVSMCDVCVLAG